MPNEQNFQNEILAAVKEIKSALNGLQRRQEAQDQKISLLESALIKKNEIRDLAVPPAYGPPVAPPRPPSRAQSKTADNIQNPYLSENFAKAPEAETSSLPETVAFKDLKNEAGRLSAAYVEKIKSESAEASAPESLEERIGGKWFLKIGIVAIVLGLSFFLKYAYDNDWIGPAGRVAIGIICGLVLLALGEKTIRKYKLYGQVMSGGGIVALYLSIYAALNFYSLINHSAAFLFMAAITALGVALSVRYNAPPLIITSVLGGFMTPLLVASGQNQQFALFSYIILLDLSVLAVSYFKKWPWLEIIGFIGTWFIFSAWAGEYYSADQLFSTFVFLTIFFIIFSISAFIYNLASKSASSGIEQGLTLAAAFIYFVSANALLDKDFHYLLGFFTLLLAIYYFVWAYFVRWRTPSDENLANFLAFLTVAFLTIAIPLQFNYFIITILWALEAVLLLYAGGRLRSKSGETIKIFALVIFVLALVRMLALDQQEYKLADFMFFSRPMLSAAFVIAAFYLGAYLLKNSKKMPGSIIKRKQIAKAFIITASLCAVFAINRDVHTYQENLIKKENNIINEYNTAIKAKYPDASAYLKKIDPAYMKNIREIKWTMIWLFTSFYGLSLMAFGLLRQRAYLLSLGVALNFFAAFMFFMKGLWEYQALCRRILAIESISALYLGGAIANKYLNLLVSENKFLSLKKTFVFFIIAANILTIFAGSRELWLHYNNKVLILKEERRAVCENSSLKKMSGLSALQNYDSYACQKMAVDIKLAENKASVAISLFWLVYAIALVVAGFWRRYKWVRIGGVSLLLIAILKLFFIDLWSLGQLYRIVASISLGAVLLGISFLYQKYRHVFLEIIKN